MKSLKFLLLGFCLSCGVESYEDSYQSAIEGHYLEIGQNDTFLKVSASQSSSLDRGSEKCALYGNSMIPIQSQPVPASGNHYRVNLREMIPGCSFSQGYVYIPHVRSSSLGTPVGSVGPQTNVFRPLANRIVNRALSQTINQSLGQCWKYVNDAVTGIGGQRMGMHAMEFFRNNSDERMRRQFGLCKMVRSNNQLETSIAAAPLGAVIGYAPGLHGHHPQYGHGEIKVSANRYCSDFCTNRANRRASFILIPCASGQFNRL
ncbi:MAG: hypothetical protein HRU19_03755 [Pseudobacteriovorax sp.]|nr:hypothetical protein [Pseudobacteriovorax sp.]